jgi:DNA-binding transcriptional LysR family regulator
MIKVKKKSSRKPDIEIKDLLLFWNIVQHGTFGRAGAAMGFSQPKVTRRVRLLEERFGTQLLFRNCRGVALTRNGEHVLEMARGIVERVEAMKSEAGAEEHGEHGTITVASASGFGHFWLVPVLKEFMDLHPGVQIEFKINHSGSTDIMMGEADILITSEPGEQRSLDSGLLCTYPLHPYASGEYLRRHGTPASLQDLDQHNLIVFSKALYMHPMSLNGLLSAGVEGPCTRSPRVMIEDDVSLFSMILSGAGIGIAPSFFFRRFGQNGEVVRLDFLENTAGYEKIMHRKHIITRGEKAPERTRRLARFIREKAEQESWSGL